MNNKLIALVGASAAATLLAIVPHYEGVILKGYKDPIGIVTACAGHTKTAVLGKRYSPQECAQLLSQDLTEHAEGVLKCTPGLKGRTYQLAAAVSFAYNVGVKSYCTSTMARLNQEGSYLAACAQLDRWVYAGGKKLRGLEIRRKDERAICELGLKDVA